MRGHVPGLLPLKRPAEDSHQQPGGTEEHDGGHCGPPAFYGEESGQDLRHCSSPRADVSLRPKLLGKSTP